ncbi:hypothetical protein KEM52_002015, partial [Ascosphaera acerosa]
MLYLHYLNKGDVYVHADVDKAVPMIVKNNPQTPDAPIPPSTLNQAGTFCVASSKAWDTKALIGAWWVKAEQVSKTTPTGEFLTAGGVFIHGDKTPLPPAQLILGFAALFQISEDSVQNHRRLRDGDAVAVVEAGERSAAVSTDDDTGSQQVADGMQEQEQERPVSAQADTTQDQLAASLEAVPESPCAASESSDEPSDIVDEQHGVTAPRDRDEATSPSVSQDDDAADALDAVSASDTPAENRSPQSQSSANPTASIAPSTPGNKSMSHVRGKHGKKKKILEKYKDQDEEDRALALRLLGSISNQTGAAAAAASPAGKGKAAPAKTKEERDAAVEAQKARRRAQHEKAAQAERERLQRLHAAQE